MDNVIAIQLYSEKINGKGEDAEPLLESTTKNHTFIEQSDMDNRVVIMNKAL